VTRFFVADAGFATALAAIGPVTPTIPRAAGSAAAIMTCGGTMEALSPELAGVDAVLAEHAEIEEFRVVRLADGRQAAVVVPRAYYSAVELRDEIWDRVPDEELPDLLVVVPSLPADPAALALDAPGAQVSGFTQPRTQTETALASCWSEILGRSRVSAGDSFLDLGGDSMSALLLLELINDRLGADLSVEDLLTAPSVGALARSIDESR
jgi:acyl carrier protein